MSQYSIDELQAALVQADAAGDTRSAQILADQIASQQADRYVKQQPQEQEADWWTGLKKGVAETAQGLEKQAIQMVPGLSFVRGAEAYIPGFRSLEEGILHGADTMKAPETTLGKVAEVAPGIAASIPGWEFGVEALAETAIPQLVEKATAKLPGAMQWVTQKALTGAAGTLGADLTSGEDMTPGNIAAGGFGNVAAETLLHTPKGLRLVSAMIQKNDADILDAAAHIGVEPTAAMASARKWLQTLEHRVGALPGGGIVGAAHEKVNQGLEAFFSQIKSGLGHVADTNELGGKIETALKGYIDNIKNESELAYDQVMRKLGRATGTNTRRFTRKIQELYGVNPREGMEKIATTPVVRKYMDALETVGITPQDTGYGNVVMNIKEARDVLKILDDYIGTGESATQDAAAAKQMATALREDINGTFLAHGLGQQWRAVQDKYAAEMDIINQANQVFRGAKGGDQYYTRLFGNPANAFKPMGKDTITALKAVMPGDVMNAIRAEVVHRMGLESAGAAAAEGRTFSPANYLTNWNKLVQPAKDALFNLTQQGDQEALAKVSEGIKRLNGAKNHSNTASHVAIGGMISALFTHPLIGAAGLVGTTAGARAMGMLLTHPEAAQILASAAAAPLRERVTKWVPMLVAIVAANPEMAAEFESAMSEGVSN